MPRHLISDVHEWRNEILTVPVFNIVILLSRERACILQRGKRSLLCLTSIMMNKWEFYYSKIPLLNLRFILFNGRTAELGQMLNLNAIAIVFSQCYK